MLTLSITLCASAGPSLPLPACLPSPLTIIIAVSPGVYSIVIPPGSCVLELCASRYSHLPGGDDDGGGGGGLQVSLLVGQGMNHQELAANPQLHQYFVQVMI